MEKQYLSLREAAESWGISERRINQYCAEGRIPGAQKIGKAWAIPADAEKPGDPRKGQPKEPAAPKGLDETCLMPLMNTAFAPGHCREAVGRTT